MTKTKYLAGAALGLTLLTGGGALVLGRSHPAVAQAEAPAIPEAPVMRVIERSIAPSAEYTGHLAAVETVELRPRVSGYVQSVNVPEGAVVRQGQLLFQIDPARFQAELQAASARRAEAEARLGLAQTEQARAEALFAQGVIARERLDQASATLRERQAQVQSASAAERLARLQLSYTRVTAPISGRVGQVLVTRGNLVAAGAEAAALTSIVSVSPFHVYFDVDETTYLAALAKARAGAALPVEIRLADGGPAQSGRLDFVANRLDAGTGTVRVRAVVANPDGRLTPGLFTRVRLVTGPAAPTPLIHDQAVRAEQGRRFVLVVGQGGKLEYRPVKLGGVELGLRVVTEGLRPGEQVVVKGLVGPGMTIRPKFVHAESLTPSPSSAG